MEKKLEDLRLKLPSDVVRSLPKNFFSNIVKCVANDVEADLIIQTIHEYMHLLQEGSYSYTDYLNAVMFVSFKRLGIHQKDAYKRVFPERYERLLAEGKADNICAYASAFAHNKLVVSLEKCFQYPEYIMNYPARGKLLKQMFDLAFNATLDKDKVAAAKVFLDATKPPEEFDAVTSAVVKSTSTLEALKQQVERLVEQQSYQINSGIPAAQILQTPLLIEDKQDEQEDS